MKAVVLAGGFGTRLRPLTLTTPKQMLPLVDRPMIEHVLAGLARHGVDAAVLALGYRGEAFRAAYPDGICAGVELSYAVEPEPLGTAGAIRFAAVAAGFDETFVAVNGDVLTDLDIRSLWDYHHRAGAEATIQLVGVDNPSRYGAVVADDGGRVVSFIEKPGAGEAPSNQVNAGVYVLAPSVLERVAADGPVSIERETFPELVADGALWSCGGDGYWIDIGTPEAYLTAQLDLLDGALGCSAPPVAATATVGVGAVVERSVVMAGASIGAGAVVRGAAVQTEAVVGAGAAVEASVIGARAVIGAGARITDGSVIGPAIAIEAGTSQRRARVPRDGAGISSAGQ